MNIAFAVGMALFVTCRTACRPADIAPVRITFPGVGEYGIFDPSIAKDPDSNRIRMSCSEVDQSPGSSANKAINTRLAYSDDFGASWTDSGTVVNQSTDIAVALPTLFDIGTWKDEVSCICCDPGAPVAERWKMLFHRYPCINGERHFEHGSAYDFADDPINGPPEVDLDSLPADLSACLAFREPALIAFDTALYACMTFVLEIEDLESAMLCLKGMFTNNFPAALESAGTPCRILSFSEG